MAIKAGTKSKIPLANVNGAYSPMLRDARKTPFAIPSKVKPPDAKDHPLSATYAPINTQAAIIDMVDTCQKRVCSRLSSSQTVPKPPKTKFMMNNVMME